MTINLKGRHYLKDLAADAKIISEWLLEKSG
jgi:hypothetical protein